MKRSILLFILIFNSCIGAFAQTYTYKPFPIDNGKWIYENPYLNTSFEYLLNNDTTIATFSYKKISINSVYAGALREENKTIYFYPDTATKEYVLYDFNLSINDIVSNPFGDVVCGEEIRLMDITYINASNGPHKYYHFNNGVFWIEGIGNIFYLLQPFKWVCCATPWCNDELKCMTSDLTFHYPAGQDPCIPTSIQSESTNTKISIFPNPSNGAFTIDFKNMLIKEISVSDVLGNVIITKTISQETSYTMPSLKTGTYTLSIIDVNNQVLHEKIVSTR